MRILTVGGGGREHAAVEALHRAGAEIYAVMRSANPGIIARAKAYIITNDDVDIDGICEFAIEHELEYAFVGPESPLEAGLVNALEDIGVNCAAPTKSAAQIETSKTFMRELMKKYGIEGSLGFASFDNEPDALNYLNAVGYEIVIKPVGLTGGKGVKVQGEHLLSLADSVAYVKEIFQKNIGGGKVIIEEKLVGEEFTQMVFVDGKKVVPLPLVQDHKRAYDGDVGPNTGGMGSYSDANHLLPFIGASDRDKSLAIIQKVVDALAAEGCPYRGPLYGQFMLTANGPKVIEFNARFGDPEAMNVLSILESDFALIIKDIVTGKLKDEIKFKNLATVCKYVVPEGYGVNPEPGHEICIDEAQIRAAGAEIYYANVDMVDGKLLTGRSRSIAVVGTGPTLEDAEKNCEKGLSFVKGDHICIRHDIGKKELIQRRIDHMKQLLQ
ncbi:MAG: phosphoribosylamine--glycine ligase [Candidatus Methanoplasma sp.]|jgi:phosphoribosylamine--glycine ligase|nr:phosphoribosylamine--glycine ligase [Candidatus Methanoplasma sp.]